MSTIYTFHRELASLATPAAGDRFLVGDVSVNANHPGAKDITLTVAGAAGKGKAATDLLGFYGASPVDQGTMTAVGLTAVTTNPTFSTSTDAGSYGFASSTVATAYVTRVRQMQADLDTLMAKISSSGLVSVTGL